MLLEAARNGDNKEVELLVKEGDLSLVNLLHELCEIRDDPEMVKILLDKDPDIVNSTLEYELGPKQGFTP